MSNKGNRETEVKLLIKFPADFLDNHRDIEKSEIVQTYLESPVGVTARIRKRVYSDKTLYYKTEKIRLTKLTAIENEGEISEEEYQKCLESEDKNRRPIIKTRYCYPYDGHIIEIDVYPFWQDRAIMEIELSDESEEYSIPDEITVIKDVSADKRYKNASLAKEIPFDEI